jgi:uncharacterized protein (TIGR03083 family)
MRVPEALDVLRLECDLVSETVLSLTEARFGLPTRCTAWNVKELLAHIHRDVEQIVVALADEVSEDPDADAVSYWTRYDPVADAPGIADRAISRAAAYRRGHELAVVWDDLWRHALDLAEREPPMRVVRTWGPLLTFDEYLKTRALEVTVHGMDMAAALEADFWTTQEAADLTTDILAGLLGEEPTPDLGWGDLTFIDKGTGREPLTEGERHVLGKLADRFPLLG